MSFSLMVRLKRLLAGSLLAGVCVTALDGVGASMALGGQYNPQLNIGDPAPAWRDLPGTDGKPHALDEFKNKAIVVVVFTCNSCPYAVDYEARINALVQQHSAAGDVGVVAINVNLVAEDSLPEMTNRAKQRGFNYPYLFDASQQIARDYGATFTPEFFVLDRDRKIAYMGALDDASDAQQARVHYVNEAITALRAGKRPAITETVARGCLVRYARQRRKPK